jgi:hypothetical protein
MLRSSSATVLVVGFSLLGVACSANTDAAGTSSDDLTTTPTSATQYEVVDIQSNKSMGAHYDQYCVVSLDGLVTIGNVGDTVDLDWANDGVAVAASGTSDQIALARGKTRTTGFELTEQDGEFTSADTFTYSYSKRPGTDFGFTFERNGDDLTIRSVRGSGNPIVRTCTLKKK